MSEEKRDKWEMPKPIFRQTDGSLPKGFGKREESWDDSTPPDVKGADPNNAMLLTMYAPPGDLRKEPDAGPATTPDSSIQHNAAVPPNAGIEQKAVIAPNAAIEPQPGISELFTVAEAVNGPVVSVKRKRGVFGKVVFAFGILVVLAAAAGLAVFLYFYYYIPLDQNNNF